MSSFWFIGFRQWWDWEVVYHTQMKSLRIAWVYCVLKPHVCPNCCCSAISHLNVLVWNLTGQKYQDEALQPVLVPSRHFLACIYAGVSYCICRDRLGWCVQRQQQLMTTAQLQVALTQQFLNNRSRHLCGPWPTVWKCAVKAGKIEKPQHNIIDAIWWQRNCKMLLK